MTHENSGVLVLALVLAIAVLLSSACRWGSGCAERSKQPPSPLPSAAEPSDAPDQKLRAADEIRQVVQQYLRTSPEKARSGLPVDLAPRLPLEIGAAEADGDGGFTLGVWRLHLEGDHAQLQHALSMTAQDRFWFQIELRHDTSGWAIIPPGVSFRHAWAKERRGRPPD